MLDPELAAEHIKSVCLVRLHLSAALGALGALVLGLGAPQFLETRLKPLLPADHRTGSE